MPVTVKGTGGGSVTLTASAAAADTTLTLPNTNGTVALTASPTFTGSITTPVVSSPPATSLTIQSAGTTAMTVDTSQNVGIGTTSPSAKLSLGGEIVQYPTSFYIAPTGHATSRRAGMQLDNWFIAQDTGGDGNKDFGIYSAVATQWRLKIDTSGNLQFNSGYGSTATAYGCRAWVRYDGNAQSLIASGNVSSVTYSGTGNYYVNLTSAMPDANYSISLGRCTLNSTQPGADGTLMVGLSSATANWIGTADQATTGFRLRFGTTGSSFFNTSYVSAAIFR